MLRCWSDEKGFDDDGQRADKSQGGRLDEIGSDEASSAQLKDVGGGEAIQMGLGVGLGCGDICELASWVLGKMVCTMASVVCGVSGVVVGIGFGVST